jgi:hypothetical protein
MSANATMSQDAAVQNGKRATPKVEEANLTAWYSNFCRVTGTPEEVIVDFGLNPQPVGANMAPVALNQRAVLNYFTAKRLMQALGATIARHESLFGTLETNVAKRAEARS